MDDLPVDKLVAAYRKIRSAVQDEEEAHKQKIASLKEQMDLVNAKLLEICNAQNVDSLRTKEGTVSRRMATRYWTSDWESMYRFIKEHDVMHLLEQRIHNGNMRTYLEDNPDVLPVGLNADTKYVISVRKPTEK
jgi:hypothetical protein